MRLIFAGLCLFLLTQCEVHRENFSINPALIEAPSTIVLVELSGLGAPCFQEDGERGFGDYVINNIVGYGMRDAISRICSREIIHKNYHEIFKAELEKINFRVHIHPEIIDVEDLDSPYEQSADHAPYDFTVLKDHLGAEYAFVLEPKFFGIRREYYSFIPLGDPYAQTQLQIYIVNLDTNELEGYFDSAVVIPADSNWDVGPEYTALQNASRQSLAGVLENARLHYFNDFFFKMKINLMAR